MKRQQIERVLETLVILAALATVPLLIFERADPKPAWLKPADWAVWAVFTGEYVAMIAITKEGRGGYLRRAWLSPLIILLSFPPLTSLVSEARLIRLARLVRLGRLLRLVAVAARAVQALRLIAGRRGLLYIAGVAAILIVVGGAIIERYEPDVETLPEGIWWAIVTTSTVGYGDITPETLEGRVSAGALMLVGVGVIATLAASIAAYFVEDDEAGTQRDVAARLDRIERKLDEIREAREVPTGRADSSPTRPTRPAI